MTHHLSPADSPMMNQAAAVTYGGTAAATFFWGMTVSDIAVIVSTIAVIISTLVSVVGVALQIYATIKRGKTDAG